MGGWLQAFLASFEAWQKYPLQFAIALVAGGAAGFWLGRLVHQSIIQALRDRITLKDDQLKIKDEAIASTSPKPSPTLVEFITNSVDAASASEDPRFKDINARVIAEADAKLRKAIANTSYQHVFNPETGVAKRLSFMTNGDVADGRNNNEYQWRIAKGRLEFLNHLGQVYSRFFLMPDGTLHHTNDADTISIKGQYLVPIR